MQGHLRRRDTALMVALPLLTLSVLLWSLTVHPYCHVHLACDGPDDPSKVRILAPAAVAAIVAIGALISARVSHVRASALLETQLSLVRPQNRRADRFLLLGAATNAAIFVAAYWLAWATRFGDTGPNLRSIGWAIVAAGLLAFGMGRAARPLGMKPPTGILQRALAIPVLLVGAFAALFCWTIIIVGPLE